METGTAELADELSELYNKAKTKEEYLEVIGKGKEMEDLLAKEEFFDVIAPVILLSYWAEYYLLLKFPTPTATMDRLNFASKVKTAYSLVANPDNKIAFLYLESVAWSNLVYNQERAVWCIIGIEKIIAEEKVSIASTLKLINASGLKEIAEKNWTEAVRIFSEIERFPENILWQPENLRHAANVTSNWGASLIRGDIDIAKGREKLLIARRYYLREEVPPEKHLEGVKNRLREADEKS